MFEASLDLRAENLPSKHEDRFANLYSADLKTGRAWAIKESTHHFSEYVQTKLDLMGRLSNPHEDIKTLISQGSTTDIRARSSSRNVGECSAELSVEHSIRRQGTAFKPFQRWLATATIDYFVQDYVGELSINALSRRFGIHRTTVINHLESRGVQRRRNHRKLSVARVTLAAGHDATGLSLVSGATEFAVNRATLTRAFRAAGFSIRPRRG